MDKPLAIAVNLVMHDNKVLLIKRANQPYVGWWALPGGKIEKHEHIKDAALRELKEETGIDAEFEKYETAFSEHIIENGLVSYHFLVHVCKVLPKTTMISASSEGEVQWVDIDALDSQKIISSDLFVLRKHLENNQKSFYEWDVDKKDEEYVLINPNNDVS